MLTEYLKVRLLASKASSGGKALPASTVAGGYRPLPPHIQCPDVISRLDLNPILRSNRTLSSITQGKQVVHNTPTVSTFMQFTHSHLNLT